jgi:methionine-rich copper-binding protein CopC
VNRVARRAAARGALAAALTLALLLGAPPVTLPRAAAHAIVLESVPARDAVLERAPERVILRFNSKIEKRLSRITLATGKEPPVPVSILTDGADVDQQPDRLVVPLRPLPPGGYVLRYKVLSADGHITEGALKFTVTGRQ